MYLWDLCVGMEISICNSIRKCPLHRLGKEFTGCWQESNSCCTSQVTTSPNRAVQKKSRLIINIDLENRAKVNQILLNRLLVE